MATDDLNAPLGLKKKQAQFRLPPYTAPVAAGLLGVVIATFAVWALFNDDPLGGEPMGVGQDRSCRPTAVPRRERKPLRASKARPRHQARRRIGTAARETAASRGSRVPRNPKAGRRRGQAAAASRSSPSSTARVARVRR